MLSIIGFILGIIALFAIALKSFSSEADKLVKSQKNKKLPQVSKGGTTSKTEKGDPKPSPDVTKQPECRVSIFDANRVNPYLLAQERNIDSKARQFLPDEMIKNKTTPFYRSRGGDNRAF